MDSVMDPVDVGEQTAGAAEAAHTVEPQAIGSVFAGDIVPAPRALVETRADLDALLARHALWIESVLHPRRKILGGRANLSESCLCGADLRGANLSQATLRGVDLEGANCEGAVFSGADLTSANMQRANLRGAKFRRAKLDGADIRGADLEGADFTGTTGLEHAAASR